MTPADTRNLEPLARLLHDDSFRDAFVRADEAWLRTGPDETWNSLPDVGRSYWYDKARRYAAAVGPSWAQVEAWLVQRRDIHLDIAHRDAWFALDGALGVLREHARTGTPLGQPVARTEEDTK